MSALSLDPGAPGVLGAYAHLEQKQEQDLAVEVHVLGQKMNQHIVKIEKHFSRHCTTSQALSMVTGGNGAPGVVAPNHVALERGADQENVTIHLRSMEEEPAGTQARHQKRAINLSVE